MKFTRFDLSISISSVIIVLFKRILRSVIISSEFLNVNEFLTFVLLLASSPLTKGIVALTENRI